MRISSVTSRRRQELVTKDTRCGVMGRRHVMHVSLGCQPMLTLTRRLSLSQIDAFELHHLILLVIFLLNFVAYTQLFTFTA